MTANDGDVLIRWVGALDLRDEARGSDDIESGNTEQSLWVVDALGLIDFSADWDGGVDLDGPTLVSKQYDFVPGVYVQTGLEITKTFASGAASAAALAKSRTIEALVLNRSEICQKRNAP